RVSKRAQRLAEKRLEVHLPGIDDVVDAARMAEGRVRRLAVARCCRPERVACLLRGKQSILKVAAEQTEFPELIGDVLADIGDDAVRSDDHLLAGLAVLALWGTVAFVDTHHPAACEASLRLQKDGACGLKNVKGVRPEAETQNVAFVRQEVVGD